MGVSVEEIWCGLGEQATSTLAFSSPWEVILLCYRQLPGGFPWLRMEVSSYPWGKWVVCLQCGPKGSDALASNFTYNRLKYPKAVIISWVSPYKLSKCTEKGRQGLVFIQLLANPVGSLCGSYWFLVKCSKQIINSVALAYQIVLQFPPEHL